MEKKIAVIGGINMDICGKSAEKIIAFDSNPGKVTLSFGGVARNIAENISRLGASVRFLSAFGNDLFGREIKEHCEQVGMDLSMAVNFDFPTSTYLFVADEEGEMQVAINDMSIYKNITPNVIEERLEKINACDYVVLDTNYEKETLEFILKNVNSPVIIDAVSIVKVRKLLDVLDKIDFLKPNKIEAEFLSGIQIVDEKSLVLAGEKLLSLGIKNVLITLGSRGVYIANSTTRKLIPAIETNVVNSTGAGDSFVGGFTYGLQREFDFEKSAILGVCASSITLQSNETVSPLMNESNLLEKFNNYNYTVKSL